jgi:HK97 family phage major capsid protein
MPAPTTTEDPTAEPNAPPATPPPADPPAPRVTFSQPEPEDRLARFREYAADLTTPQIEGTIDSIRAAGITETNADQLEGFTAELRSRQRTDTAARQRMEHLQQLADLARGVVPAPPSAHELFASDDYAHAFGDYLRTGDKNGMAQFAQSISGTGAEGGYTVPDDFRTKFTEAMAAYGGIQQAAEVLETNDGRSLPWPTNNDTANSAVVATEGAAPGSAGADLVFGEVNLGAFSIAATGTSTAPLKVSWELLQDSAFDFAGFVSRKLGERLGRKAAAYYATGVGTTEPFGLLAKTPDTMTATTMFAALVEHHFQVDEAYRSGGNCRWVFSDSTLAKVYGSVDLQGRPLFIPSADSSGAGRPAGMLLGYPVQLDQGAGTLVAFGDIRAGFVSHARVRLSIRSGAELPVVRPECRRHQAHHGPRWTDASPWRADCGHARSRPIRRGRSPGPRRCCDATLTRGGPMVEYAVLAAGDFLATLGAFARSSQVWLSRINWEVVGYVALALFALRIAAWAFKTR